MRLATFFVVASTIPVLLLVACGDRSVELAADIDAMPVLDGGLDAGIADIGTTDAGATLARLRADSTKIVDSSGETIVLRGVNLGGWLFHEPWITQLDFSTLGRARMLSAQDGISSEVDAAITEVGMAGDFGMRFCAGNYGGWIDAFQAALAMRIDPGDAKAFVDKVKQYQSLCTDSDYNLRVHLQGRFGTAGRDELLDIFQRAWITEADISWLAGQGFNLVRVPIGYRSLITAPESMEPASLPWNEQAFARLDNLLVWCGRHGIYAVLDIQEAPGGQNDYVGEAHLYDNPAMQALTVDLWAELSDRFRDRDEVAAYSLLAEPFKAPSAKARDDMYDRIVQAIRAKGDDHLLVIHDGFFGMVSMPLPSEYGWSNVVYSTHLFETDLRSLEGFKARIEYYDPAFVEAQKEQGVPYFIGSFSVPTDAAWAYASVGALLDWYEKRHWSWSIWTYKRVENPAVKELFDFQTLWGVRGRLGSEFYQPDVYLEDYDTLKSRLAGYEDLVLNPTVELLNELRLRLPQR